jgi:hypothetical protein
MEKKPNTIQVRATLPEWCKEVYEHSGMTWEELIVAGIQHRNPKSRKERFVALQEGMTQNLSSLIALRAEELVEAAKRDAEAVLKELYRKGDEEREIAERRAHYLARQFYKEVEGASSIDELLNIAKKYELVFKAFATNPQIKNLTLHQAAQ